MYIPLVREHVRVRGSVCTFLVVQVDYVREVAELESECAEKKPMHKVPFEDMFATWEDPEVKLSGPAEGKRRETRRREFRTTL
ncbi:MAG TPA: hypothetical protein VGL22_10705 [Terracidiphilus sp.]